MNSRLRWVWKLKHKKMKAKIRKHCEISAGEPNFCFLNGIAPQPPKNNNFSCERGTEYFVVYKPKSSLSTLFLCVQNWW